MARNHSTDSRSTLRESVDSCFNEAFYMSSTDTVSNTTLDQTEVFAQTVSTASFISTTSTLERTITSEFATDATMTSDVADNDLSASLFEDSSIQRVELRPTNRYRPTTEPASNSRPNTTWGNAENATFTACHTSDRAEGGCCRKVDTGTGSSLEKSHLWPILTNLQKNLSGSSDKEERKADEIVHDLYISFNSDPWEFTDHLLTIIEESSLLSMSGTSEASSSLLSRLGHTDSTQYMSLGEFASKGAEGLDCAESFVSPVTPKGLKGASHSAGRRNDTPTLGNVENRTFTKTAKVRGVPRSCEKQELTERSQTNFNSEETPESSISSIAFEECSSQYCGRSAYQQTPRFRREIRAKRSTHLASVKTPGSSDHSRTFEDNYSDASNPRNVSYLEVPKIVVIPDTPQQVTSKVEKCSLENDSKNTTFPETDEPKDETLDMSKVSLRRGDCKGAFEHRKERENACITKWERRWVRQLVKKREKCYSTIMRSIENKTLGKNECTCDNCVVLTDFYKTMIVLNDYYISTSCATDNVRRSETRVVNKIRRSVSGSRKSTNREVAPNSQTSGKSTKKVTRKSIGRKSPAGKSKSPRYSVVVKPNIRSPFRLKSSRPRAGPMSEIDCSSIGSVAELRKKFSPRATKSGSAVTKIPLPQKFAPEKVLTTCVITNPVPRTSSTNKFTFGGTSGNKNFFHVKSPVGEYIRGTKVIRKKNAASPNEK